MRSSLKKALVLAIVLAVLLIPGIASAACDYTQANASDCANSTTYSCNITDSYSDYYAPLPRISDYCFTSGSCGSTAESCTDSSCTDSSCEQTTAADIVTASNEDAFNRSSYSDFFAMLMSWLNSFSSGSYYFGNSCTNNSSLSIVPQISLDAAADIEQEAIPAAGSISSTLSQYAAEILRLVNAERAAEGIAALTLDQSLVAGAQIRAVEIVTSFSHTRPDGTTCFTALSGTGAVYQRAAENIAIGQTTPAQAVQAWMDSPSHRAALMSADYTRTGIGVVKSSGAYGGYAWAQFFAD